MHRSYRRIKITLFVFAVANVPLAIAIKTGLIDPIIAFPFSSWSLYTRVPNQSVVYSVEIFQSGQWSSSTPIDFLDSKPLGSRRTGVWAHHVIQDLGRAIEGGEIERAEMCRTLFERNYLSEDKPIHYRIVRRTVDPLEYVRHGKRLDEVVLMRFRAGEP